MINSIKNRYRIYVMEQNKPSIGIKQSVEDIHKIMDPVQVSVHTEGLTVYVFRTIYKEM
jgi:hypothetical protein